MLRLDLFKSKSEGLSDEPLLALFSGEAYDSPEYSMGVRQELLRLYGSPQDSLNSPKLPDGFLGECSFPHIFPYCKQVLGNMNDGLIASRVKVDESGSIPPSEGAIEGKQVFSSSCLPWKRSRLTSRGLFDQASYPFLSGHIAATKRLPRSLYLRTLDRTRFLLAPEGWSPQSPRPIEAVASGKPPVVLSLRLRLPGDDFINWEAISLRLPASPVSMRMLECRMRSVTTDQYDAMVRKIALVQPFLLWGDNPRLVADWVLGQAWEVAMKKTKICAGLEKPRNGLQVEWTREQLAACSRIPPLNKAQ